MKYDEITDLIGKTLKSVTRIENERIEFVAEDGSEWAMYHSQDCCESVVIYSVEGSLSFLVGSPILAATKDASAERPKGIEEPKYAEESETWSVFTITTKHGTVKIVWHGSSNGYYSESVDFSKTN